MSKKLRGIFVKLPAPAIFYNYQIIFLLKILWNSSTVWWTESTALVHESTESSLTEGVWFLDEWPGFNQ
jgi:hypothetical protein